MDSESLGKASDAVAETAKAAGKAIDTLNDTGSFFNKAFGDIVVDGIGLVRDRLKFYRFERASVLAHETTERLKAKGVSEYRSLHPSVGIPLIEHATLEDDDELSERWAALLASALDPSSVRVTKRMVTTLSELSPLDARLVDHLYNDGGNEYRLLDAEDAVPSGYDDLVVGFLSAELAKELGVTEENLSNCYRLGLIAHGYLIRHAREQGSDFRPGLSEQALELDNILDLLESPTSSTIREDIRSLGLSLVTQSAFGHDFYKAVKTGLDLDKDKNL